MDHEYNVFKQNYDVHKKLKYLNNDKIKTKLWTERFGLSELRVIEERGLADEISAK